MMTNWEYCFGTVERAAKTRVTYYGGVGSDQRIAVEHNNQVIVDDLPKRSYKKWLSKNKAPRITGRQP